MAHRPAHDVTLSAAKGLAASRSFAHLARDVRACAACDAMAHVHALGPANGPLVARAIFVAEAPGRRGAALTGVPLTRDDAGRRFEAFLALAGLARSDVFVTNAVLCNPLDASGHNRPPAAREVQRCRAFLACTLDIVEAPVVVALGRVALDSLRAIAPHDATLGRDAGCALAWRGRVLVPMYHPARRATLRRTQQQQDADWRRLGEIVRTLDVSPVPAPRATMRVG